MTEKQKKLTLLLKEKLSKAFKIIPVPKYKNAVYFNYKSSNGYSFAYRIELYPNGKFFINTSTFDVVNKEVADELKKVRQLFSSKNIKEVKKITKEIKDTATKFSKKALKLEGTQMKYTKLKKLLLKAILHKRKAKLIEDIYKRIHEEEKEVVPSGNKNLSLIDKRKKLKEVYKRILRGTPYAENIPVFMDLIDQVPEDYLNYELDIDFGNAYKVVDELIRGKGDLTPNEMGELANIVSGVGIPAIEKHASGKEKLDKKTAKFGAEELSKSAQRFNKSVEQRRDPKGKLEAPKTTAVAKIETSKELAPIRKELAKLFTTIDIPKESPFWNTATKLKSKGINVERLAKSMLGAKKYTDAKTRAAKELNKQEVGVGIEDLRGTDDIFNIWNQIKKQKERVKVRVKR